MNNYEFSSAHAIDRARERLGLSASAANRRFEKVLRLGKRADDFKEWYPHNYLRSLEQRDSRAFLYGDAIYIFRRDQNICITTYQIPQEFYHGGPNRPTKAKHLRQYKHRNWTDNYEDAA